MNDLEFSRSDIVDLATKLDSLKTQLSDNERKLLLAIFSAASSQVWQLGSTAAAVPGEPTLTDLREQLIKAFIPADAPADDPAGTPAGAPKFTIRPNTPIIIPPHH
jgi:hypothetical protein